jgi:uncharacterized membrane protein
MGLFKKRIHIVPDGSISKQVNSFINVRQRRLADYLNLKAKHVSSTALLYGLIIFCAVFGSYLLYLLTSVFSAVN